MALSPKLKIAVAALAAMPFCTAPLAFAQEGPPVARPLPPQHRAAQQHQPQAAPRGHHAAPHQPAVPHARGPRHAEGPRPYRHEGPRAWGRSWGFSAGFAAGDVAAPGPYFDYEDRTYEEEFDDGEIVDE